MSQYANVWHIKTTLLDGIFCFSVQRADTIPGKFLPGWPRMHIMKAIYRRECIWHTGDIAVSCKEVRKPGMRGERSIQRRNRILPVRVLLVDASPGLISH